MDQNDKTFCLSHSISQEMYIIWLWFLVHMSKMIISPAVSFFILMLIFWFFRRVKGQNYQFYSVMFYISGTVDHVINIFVCRCKIIMFPGVFLYFYFFKKCIIVNVKIILFFKWLTSTVFFLINSCFSSSSVNARNKFWVVPHLLHMCVILKCYRENLSSVNLMLGE